MGREPGIAARRHPACRVASPASHGGIHSEGRAEDGLKQTSCVNLTNVFTVRKSELRHDVGCLTGAKMREVCRALNIACGCA